MPSLSSLHDIPCPVCAAPTVRHCEKLRYDVEWKIRRCTKCGHGFVANRPTPELLDQIYNSLPPYDAPGAMSVENLNADTAAVELAEITASLTKERGATLDVGCGSGAFSYHMHMQGFTPHVLIDPDPRLAATTAHYPDSRFEAVIWEDFRTTEMFSAIIMSQALEHALDPADWLIRAREMMTPGGILAIALPNFGGVYRLLGERDPMLIPPFHLNFFTATSLKLLLNANGLTPLRVDSRSQISIHGKFKFIQPFWNAFAFMLRPTTRGVILRAFATPATK